MRALLVVIEEAEFYCKNIKGNVSQNLFRIMHSGRNKQNRVVAITTDLALIDTSYIRLCGQLYHARLTIEENSRPKFKNTYGKTWLETTERSETGRFMYFNVNELSTIHVHYSVANVSPLTSYNIHLQQHDLNIHCGKKLSEGVNDGSKAVIR